MLYPTDMERTKLPHMAIHFSKHNPQGTVIIQGRSTQGQFLKPDIFLRPASYHYTKNGKVLQKGRF